MQSKSNFRCWSTRGTQIFNKLKHRDGIHYLNIAPDSPFKFARDLDLTSKLNLVHPRYDTFDCLEGFYVWLATGKVRNFFRRNYGVDVRKAGKSYIPSTVELTPEIKDEILLGLHLRFQQHPELLTELREGPYAKLPLIMVYHFGNNTKDGSGRYRFVLEEIERIRAGLPLRLELPGPF